LLDGIIDRNAKATANRVLSILTTFFRWAVTELYIEKDPTANIALPTMTRSRERVLIDDTGNADEIVMFWAACDKVGWPYGLKWTPSMGPVGPVC
jgi:site-specific recombinase XerD